MRQTSELARQYQAESLARAQNGDVNSNYAIIMREFMARGIASADINPRENVLTFNAWKALGRHVRKGEHGVAVVTFIPAQAKVDASGNESAPRGSIPRTAYVFHVSQTEADERRVS